MKTKQYTIEELCELTGFSRRTIRYYVQEGLIASPAGRGRGGFYFDSHLERLRKMKAMQNDGLKLSRIQELLKEGKRPKMAPLREVWIRYPIEPGIELHIRRDLDEAESKKLSEIIRVAKSILKGGTSDE